MTVKNVYTPFWNKIAAGVLHKETIVHWIRCNSLILLLNTKCLFYLELSYSLLKQNGGRSSTWFCAMLLSLDSFYTSTIFYFLAYRGNYDVTVYTRIYIKRISVSYFTKYVKLSSIFNTFNENSNTLFATWNIYPGCSKCLGKLKQFFCAQCIK